MIPQHKSGGGNDRPLLLSRRAIPTDTGEPHHIPQRDGKERRDEGEKGGEKKIKKIKNTPLQFRRGFDTILAE